MVGYPRFENLYTPECH